MELTGESLSGSAIYGGWLLFLCAFTLFLCAPILGNLSDRVGRRPVLMTRLLRAFTSESAPVFFSGAAHFAAGLPSLGALASALVASRRSALPAAGRG
jgi:MFS family permease